MGKDAVQTPLEAKAKEQGLDPEVASRIAQILEKLNPNEGKTITDAASGRTFRIGGRGNSVEAVDTASGKVLWSRVVADAEITSLRLEKGHLRVLPAGLTLDPQTGAVRRAALEMDHNGVVK